MAIGLPTISIVFKKLAATLIERSQRGIVALIVKDDTQAAPTVNEYKSISSIEDSKFTATNLQYIKDVFTGGAFKVFVISVDSESTKVVADAITLIGSRKFNWIGLAEGTAAEQTALSAHVKQQEAKNKSIKAIVHKATTPDCMHVVNFTTAEVTYKTGETVTGEKFIPRLLGTLAGLPLTRSSTAIPFTDLSHVSEPADLDTAINNGEFILYNDEETVRIARGVNSLKTLAIDLSEDFKKILIVESLDQIREDITTVWKDNYLGQFKNTYDNQILFISDVNTYFQMIASEGVLDDSFSNVADVNVEKQRQAWLNAGRSEATDWDDQTVKNRAFRSNVFLAGNIMCPDAMEDFNFDVTLE